MPSAGFFTACPFGYTHVLEVLDPRPVPRRQLGASKVHMRSCSNRRTGHAQGEDDVLQSRIDHIALKIARRVHKLYRRRRKSDSEISFTALGLRARDPESWTALKRGFS